MSVKRSIIVFPPEHIDPHTCCDERGIRSVIGMTRIVYQVVAVLSGKVEEEVFLALPGNQSGDIDTIGGDPRADLEPVIAGAGNVILEDITAKIDSRRIQALLVIDHLALDIPPVLWLITGDEDELIEIRAQRMRERLVVVGIVVYRIVMLVGIGANRIGFE